ncbi:MAG: redoxin domain-containing protein [bacterium]
MSPRPHRSQRLVSALGGLALAVCAVAGLDWIGGGPGLGIAAPAAPKVGDPAPDFEVTDLANRKVKLAELRGSPVFLNFWATWCPPCVEEMPSIAAIARQYGDQGLRVVAVNVDAAPAATIQKWLDGRKLALEVWLDPNGAIAHQFGTFKYPETFIIDRAGKIQAKYVGSHPWTQPPFDAMLATLVAGGGAAPTTPAAAPSRPAATP